MKRYLLFSGDSYCPSGGVSDYVKSFSSMKAIEQHLKDLHKKDESPYWANALDVVTGTRYAIDMDEYRFNKLEECGGR